MRNHSNTLLAAAGTVLFTAFASSPVACAQDTSSSYRAPRTVDGQPDLQGIWRVMSSANFDIQDHSASLGVPAGMGIVEGNELPYVPTALAIRQANYRERYTADPESKCFMVGTPRIMYMPFPFQIVQTSDQVNIISEYVHTPRTLRFDSEHPEGPEWIMGDSRAHWEDDTLVVDVANFTDGNWLDRSGNFTSNNLHVVERYTRIGPDHMRYEATVEDPDVFSRPWNMDFILYRQIEPRAQLLEYECQAYLTAEHDKNDTQ